MKTRRRKRKIQQDSPLSKTSLSKPIAEQRYADKMGFQTENDWPSKRVRIPEESLTADDEVKEEYENYYGE